MALPWLFPLSLQTDGPKPSRLFTTSKREKKSALAEGTHLCAVSSAVLYPLALFSNKPPKLPCTLLGKVRENFFVDLDHERRQDCFLQIIPRSTYCSPFIWHKASRMGNFLVFVSGFLLIFGFVFLIIRSFSYCGKSSWERIWNCYYWNNKPKLHPSALPF